MEKQIVRYARDDTQGRLQTSQPLKLIVVVLAEAGGNERAGLRRADGLARSGLGENDVPEVGVWRGEGDTDKAAFALFAQGSDVALDRLGGHFIKNADILPGDERRVHK